MDKQRFQKAIHCENIIRQMIHDKDFSAWKNKLFPHTKFDTGKHGSLYQLEGVDCVVKVISISNTAKEYFESQRFGVWRELHVCRWINQLIFKGECPNYPLMYYWKIVKNCNRFIKLNQSTSSNQCLFLFFERADLNLYEWIVKYSKDPMY
jgi:hypothetical protein